ncbi:MAG: ring-cleaving dioxygenase [Pseudomonas sp.]|nr:ring-cleaving dioxygenase [Pseudomonas sp.]
MHGSKGQPRATTILGLHHISTVVRDFERSLRFYLGTLDLNLFSLPKVLDGRQSMHFYCGDGADAATSLLSFMIDENALPGSCGSGQISAVTLAVPAGSLLHWQRRLEDHGVRVFGRAWAFGKEHLCFSDPDGLNLALIEDDERTSTALSACDDQDYAIRRLCAVEVQVDDQAQTAKFLTGTLGFSRFAREGAVSRYRHDAMSSAVAIDVLSAPMQRAGCAGTGVVNDVVWRVPNEQMLGQIVSAVKGSGQPILFECERDDFKAVYFRDPCGIHFAVALDQAQPPARC